MKKLERLVSRLSIFMSIIAATALFCVMLLTVLDVILRYFGHPITGVYDLVALGGAVVIGFAIPYAAEKRVHVLMEMVQQMLSRGMKLVLYVFTRVIAFGISLLVAWNLVALGLGFHTTGEASLTIQIVFWPIAIGLGVCFALQTLIFVLQIFQGPSEDANE